MAHKYATIFKWINVVLDYAILNGALYLCFLLSDYKLAWMNVYDYRISILLLNFCWFYCSHIFDIYSNILSRESIPVITSNLAALCMFTVMAILIKLLLPYLYIPPTPFIYYFALFPTLILTWRFSFLLLRKYRRGSWLGSNSIAIIGADLTGINLYKYLQDNPQLDYQIAGIFDDDSRRVPAYIKYLGSVNDSISYASDHKISELYCALPYSQSDKIETLLQEADHKMVRLRLVPDMKGNMQREFSIALLGYLPVLKPRQEPLENKANEVIKRAFDVLFSMLVILLLLSWLIPLMAIIIKLDSQGPVFFKQLRSGKNNKPFYCLKFRSMTINNYSDVTQASKEDIRVTKVGKFIRKTSIDELPQFINVFVGDMSVVGPRPHMLKHTTDYSQVINNYMVRHFLTPGITGWAQINGFRGETKETRSMLNRVQADLWYLEHWSILLDIKIIFLTICQILTKHDNVY
ncbi:undecaprenyl-phosphate glucose phosphotransferase [Pontibacter ramchanderi]|uniref:Undecaprenyl-phosphate galactose phosphotransferase/putative colanic acid biosynthesis UDP-glucose lipid carrier transferase n=1 Tax=Pontibacter ramchanderi TaxID=1179743 RepID=A0A2N3V1K7_9BACT|nr:undecaprenyl-phosphate glucose phosphotransferase [Pontibacter ramchanderi]PKV75507.1 undecaprenyl-phosphate galactose phosphotransferase/putative colanic acid biosynthesis UDP-glucose lipid carrier transferase [Pontibacter ramchanderi]